MMKTYKLTIRPLTSFRTPLQSDTIFGHLMWALRYTEGEDTLVQFLARYRDGDPPLLVSAGFPEGTLPVPVLGPEPKDPKERERNPANEVVGAMLHKALEDGRYLPLPQWHQLAQNVSARTLKGLLSDARTRLRELKKEEQEHLVTRTAVDRITGSARKGRLFVAEETFYGPGRKFEIWHKLDESDDKLLERLARWWRWIQRNGFGRGKSTGHGAFRIVGQGLVEAGAELPQVANPNGFVTLSAWVPRSGDSTNPGDPTGVTYRTRVKRGKLAEALALSSPWKKPLLMLEPGAVARLSKKDGGLRGWYGGLVAGVHWPTPDVPDGERDIMQDIVQYGYAFPLPVHIEEGA
ncbi:MAG: hypothetical protein SWK90_00410 [Chloroflexota bacterium]|nr:hypothetical protein [Chloroflexota bacterium]